MEILYLLAVNTLPATINDIIQTNSLVCGLNEKKSDLVSVGDKISNISKFSNKNV
jgi:hypothetical protein